VPYYDIIGDVHGYATILEKLLKELGYKKKGGTYHHRSRQAVIVGDIIDRGPQIREALHIVKRMVVEGSALMVLGNHEFNAIGWNTKWIGEYLRSQGFTEFQAFKLVGGDAEGGSEVFKVKYFKILELTQLIKKEMAIL
jgi:hypothetical protein